MTARAFPALVGALLLLQACGICRRAPSVTETTNQTIHVIEHTEFIPVITEIKIPVISLERTTRDSTSFLENQYASSTARINTDGSLYHDLNTKPQTIQQKHEVPVQYRDSIVFRDREVTKEVEVEVEKKLSWWQRIRLDGFWLLLAALLFAYRRHIFALIK